MYVNNVKPIRSLKDKYKIDRKISIQKEVLKETGFNCVGLGEIKDNLVKQQEKSKQLVFKKK